MSVVAPSPPEAPAAPRPARAMPAPRPRRAGAWLAWLTRSGRFPITLLGLVAIPTLYFTMDYFSGEHTDRIIRSVCIGGLALIAFDILAVVATALWLLLRPQARSDERLVLEVAQPTRTGFRLNEVRWNPLTRTSLEWEEPQGKAELVQARGGWEEQVVPTGRGEGDSILRCFVIEDLFGLSRMKVRRREHRPVICVPSEGRPTVYEIREQFKPGDQLGHPNGQPLGDLIEMRRYVAGDPLKLVLWRIFARTGVMLVRTPERAVSPTDRTLAYLVAGEGDEPSAGLARLAIEQGLLGKEVIFSADGAPEQARTQAEAVSLIVRSVRHRRTGGSHLDEFLGRGEEIGSPACVLFVPHVPGAWLKRVESALSRHVGPFRVIVGVDGAELSRGRSRLRRALLNDGDSDRPRARDVETVVRKLRKVGAEVIVLDRQSGSKLMVKHEGEKS